MATIDQEIAELEAILNTGATSTGVGDQRVTWDLDEIRRRLAELRRQQDHTTRPRIMTMDLSNF